MSTDSHFTVGVVIGGRSLPSPETLLARGEALDADQCATVYAPHALGTLAAPSDFWQQCVVPGFVLPLSMTWDSPDSGLIRKSDAQGRKTAVSVYRTYVWGQFAGTEEKLLEGDITTTDTGL